VVFFEAVESFGAFSQSQNNFVRFVVHRDQSLSRFCLAGANYDDAIQEINILPLELLDLASPHRGAECQGHRSLSTLPFFILSGSVQQTQFFIVGKCLSNGARHTIADEQANGNS
jgi:hypothetical protein